jgi:hypothetical protein
VAKARTDADKKVADAQAERALPSPRPKRTLTPASALRRPSGTPRGRRRQPPRAPPGRPSRTPPSPRPPPKPPRRKPNGSAPTPTGC